MTPSPRFRERVGPVTWSVLWAALGWSLVCLVMALASYKDQLSRGQNVQIWSLFRLYLPFFFPWLVFSVVMHQLLAGRFRRRLGEPRLAFVLLASGGIGFFLPYLGYQTLLQLFQRGESLSLFWKQAGSVSAMNMLVDGLLYLVGFSVHYGIAFFNEVFSRERAKLEIETENFRLKLALEQQRLASLQAQLEPHFLFNALNAISSLVRVGDRPGSLAAIHSLGELLRYASTAGRREWVTLGEELDFLRDYLAMQTLRHGDRLQVEILGESPSARAAEVPPLLLQPLVENAIRHDLECHEGPSRVSLLVEDDADRVGIRVISTLRDGTPANPGLGLGLPLIRDRLASLYGPRATFVVQTLGDRFTAIMSLPVCVNG